MIPGFIRRYEHSGLGSRCIAVINNIIVSNSVMDSGGGIYLYKSCARIEGNEIRDNKSWVGGGIFIEESTPLIANNRFIGNELTLSSGGAINCWKSSAVIDGNVFTKNHGGSAGAIDCVDEARSV